jgi:hypothetical protein
MMMAYQTSALQKTRMKSSIKGKTVNRVKITLNEDFTENTGNTITWKGAVSMKKSGGVDGGDALHLGLMAMVSFLQLLYKKNLVVLL